MASIPLCGSAAPINPTIAQVAIAKLDLRSREAVESLVEHLIEFLDAADGDTDAEDGDVDCCEAYDDRPVSMALGCNDPHSPWAAGDPDDAEDEAPPADKLAHRKRRVGAIVGTRTGAAPKAA